MTAAIWRAFGRQLRRPEGVGGAFVGRLMATANRRSYRLALDALEASPGQDALELGFGPGAGIAALSRLVKDGVVAGVDHAPSMLRQAMARNRRAVTARRVDLRLGRFDALPWADASFDRALLVNVVYFFGEAGREAAELRRVLRPGGRAVVYATDRSTMVRWPFADTGTHGHFDADSLRALLVGGGFDATAVSVREVDVARGVAGLVAVAVAS